jgi:hypothetical protein
MKLLADAASDELDNRIVGSATHDHVRPRGLGGDTPPLLLAGD